MNEILAEWISNAEGDVDIRYPGESSTKDEARDAVKVMKQVREFVQGKLPKSK